jgi:DNA-binding XRE family transcriptional regulator
MFTAAKPTSAGILVTFADGRSGVVPFADIPEIKHASNLKAIAFPNPYEIVLHGLQGEVAELPWDFARHYCDPSYEPRVRAIAASGRESIGNRLRELRKAAGITQDGLAAAAGIGRVTLVRIESGEQSPRLETLAALSAALGRPLTDLLVIGSDA